MRWLVLVMVANRPDCHHLLRSMLAAVPDDFSVYHFDASSERDLTFRAYAQELWYSGSKGQIVHRGFRSGTGCILESLKLTIDWMLDVSAKSYTHLWKLDSDLDFGVFHYSAFRALVANRAPFLSQPAILPWKKGRRSTDRLSLVARIASTSTVPVTDDVDGRARILSQGLKWHVRDDVEIMCPLMDATMLPALRDAIAPMDTRNDFAAGDAMNVIAREFARVSPGPWPPVNASVIPPSQRPAGLVFDFVPLIHRDTRLVGWGKEAYKLVNGTRCPRVYMPGAGRRFGQGWQERVVNASRTAEQTWTWMPSARKPRGA